MNYGNGGKGHDINFLFKRMDFDVPLNDISNENATPVKVTDSELQKGQPSNLDQNYFNKRRCVTHHDQALGNQGRQFPNQNFISGKPLPSTENKCDRGSSNVSPNNNFIRGKLSNSMQGSCLNIPIQPSKVLVPFVQEVALPRDSLITSPKGYTSGCDDDLRSGHTFHSSKRKRKFPGPAGLLPQLGQRLNSPDISKRKEDTVSPVQVIEKTDLILSSQSGEELFNDRPWQTLMSDIKEIGQDTLQQFSLASSLQKAKKKQLMRGKVPFVMAVIETLEWPAGKDACVTLKDKSGSIQGTIHESLMKEHGCDFQTGSVLVLRQVSVISPTSRNHYLNITPANIVCVYCIKSKSLTRLRFLDKDRALPTIFKDMEREMMVNFTPQKSATNICQSMFHMGTPDVRTPQSGLNMRTTNIRNQQSRFASNTPTPRFSTPDQRSVKNDSAFVPVIHKPKDWTISFHSGTISPVATQGGKAPVSKIPQGGMVSTISTAPGCPVDRTTKNTPGFLSMSKDPATPGVTNSDRLKPGLNTGKSQNPSKDNQSGFQKPETASSALLSHNTPRFTNKPITSSHVMCASPTNIHVAGKGQCHVTSCPSVVSSFDSDSSNQQYNHRYTTGNVSTTGLDLSTSTLSSTNTPYRKRFKFKSLTSPDNSLGLSLGNKFDNVPPVCSAIITSQMKANVGVENLWQDDLSDDILSQLSEELM
ncbi:uncharacterized protein LOC132549616 [Ylistrum balloti]|uniref:uncharacterized protein LOC132549616 n=1 Tax=Ylistrum balloti TaxID=509963 RepID=UPI002905A635|nr:uncharacterized protein LOC132549616 [Ylistrum balloti]